MSELTNNSWPEFGRGLAGAFGLCRYRNRFQLLTDRFSRPTWAIVGEALADAMNDYGADMRKANPEATLPRRAEPLAGSLPDPEILAHYEREWPGSAEQILSMAENSLHQRSGEPAGQRPFFMQPYTLGFLAGTAMVLSILLVGFWLVSMGHWLPGMVGMLLVAAISVVQFRVAKLV